MLPAATPNPYKRHRFPGEIISHAVWLYYRFSLSHRDVEELLFERGIMVSYEAIRKGCRKFGQGACLSSRDEETIPDLARDHGNCDRVSGPWR
jgi:putative transposase